MGVSYSQLQTYRRCPKQYEFMTVKKIPRRITPGESFGSGIHNALQRWGNQEILTASPAPALPLTLFTDDTPPEKLRPLELTTLLTFWRECFIAEAGLGRTEMDANLARGDLLLRQFFDWWNCKARTVAAIETGFKLTVPPTPEHQGRPLVLTGRFDRIERTPAGLHIIDYKTGGTRPQKDVDEDLQLSIYALAAADQFQETVAELTLLFLGEDGLVERTTTRNDDQLKGALTAIRKLGDGITNADFHADPQTEKCRWCPYREICPESAA